MTRTSQFLCPLGLVAALMLNPQAGAGDPEKTKTVDEKLDQILKEIKTAKADADLQKSITDQEIQRLQKRVADLEKEIDRLRGVAFYYSPEGADAVRAMKDRLEKLERNLRAESRFYPPSDTVVAPPRDAGSVRVRNHSMYASTVTINGRSVMVYPGQAVTVPNVPAGTFTYEVYVDGFGVIGRRSPTMLAGDVFPLNIE
jgi:hypothetical protein